MSCLCLVRVSLLRCWVAMEGPCLCNSTNKETSKKKTAFPGFGRKSQREGAFSFLTNFPPQTGKTGEKREKGWRRRGKSFLQPGGSLYPAHGKAPLSHCADDLNTRGIAGFGGDDHVTVIELLEEEFGLLRVYVSGRLEANTCPLRKHIAGLEADANDLEGC